MEEKLSLFEEMDRIEKEREIVLEGEKPLIECSAEDLSDRQWELYKSFRNNVYLRHTKSDKNGTINTT